MNFIRSLLALQTWRAVFRDMYSLSQYKRALSELGLWRSLHGNYTDEQGWFHRKMGAIFQLCLIYVAFWMTFLGAFLVLFVLSFVLVLIDGVFPPLLKSFVQFFALIVQGGER